MAYEPPKFQDVILFEKGPVDRSTISSNLKKRAKRSTDNFHSTMSSDGHMLFLGKQFWKSEF